MKKKKPKPEPELYVYLKTLNPGQYAKLREQKESDDDLIAKLARKVIDHYLFFQTLLKTDDIDLDTVSRFADECRDLVETNLPLFMSLSAQGRNIHSAIDERVQR